jgi:hypothetical protein
MSIDLLVSRHWFACLLVVLHTLLVGVYAWIELDDAWNDMNPTMLVMLAIATIDYPIHLVLQPLINNQQSIGTYLAATLVLGGAFWFAMGTIVTYVCRQMKHTFIRSAATMRT